VIIIGAGPAGIFAALELSRKDPGLSVLILDKGHGLEKRKCPGRGIIGGCLNCDLCSITSGWGGAGAFSDGKLTLTNRFGGFSPRIPLEEPAYGPHKIHRRYFGLSSEPQIAYSVPRNL